MEFYKDCWENNIDKVCYYLSTITLCPDYVIKKNSAMRVFAYIGNIGAVEKLLCLGADPYAQCRPSGALCYVMSGGADLSYRYHYPAIILAAMKNNADIVKIFMRTNNYTKLVNKLLYFFCVHKNMDMIKYIFDQGVAITVIESDCPDFSSLWHAINTKWYDLISYYIDKKLDINHKEFKNWFCYCYNDEKMVDLLISNGFDPCTFRPNWGFENESDLDFFTKLIPQGMKFDSSDWGWALCMACQNGQHNLVQKLVDNGVNITDRCNMPYKYAAEYGHLQCLKILIDKNPDYFASDTVLVTTLVSLASENNRTNIIEYLDQIGLLVVTDILAYNAVKSNNIELLKFFVLHGANVRSNNNYALRLALNKGHTELADYLCEIGCDLSSNNYSIVYWATMLENKKVIEYLANHGIGIDNLCYVFAKEKYTQLISVG